MCIVEGCRKKKAKYGQRCHKHAKQYYRKHHPLKAAYQALRDNAKRRGKEFQLTLDEFKRFAKKAEYEKRGKTRESYHIDRIDESKGYTLDNIQLIPNYINVKKYHAVCRYYTEYEDLRAQL
ncbi:MAG: hypothetical protein R3345_06945 [Fulvivirga sp.]|nr:hypothetical protein [Fulvivirga sp.]